jgi:hypothetical protein
MARAGASANIQIDNVYFAVLLVPVFVVKMTPFDKQGARLFISTFFTGCWVKFEPR